MNKFHKFSPEENAKMLESHDERFHGRHGVFSGTEVCDCGGKIVYIPMRTNFSKGVAGQCEKCKREYIDYTGKHVNNSAGEIGLDAHVA